MNENQKGEVNDPDMLVHHFLAFHHEDDPGIEIMAFESLSPFGQISPGDYISTRGWNLGLQGRYLCAVSLSHDISAHGVNILHHTIVLCRWDS